MQILAIAQQGMEQAQGRVEQAASRIASLGTAGANPAQPNDNINLSDEMISLMQAKNDFEANLKVAHTADDLQKQTLDLLA